MKPVNLEKILFPLNGVVTAVVFFLLAPTTRIYASWFPEKKAELWWAPVGLLVFSAVLWIFTSLAMPHLIKKGVFEDRRKGMPREGRANVDLSRVLGALSVFTFHMAVLIIMSVTLVIGMNKGMTGKIFPRGNIAWDAP